MTGEFTKNGLMYAEETMIAEYIACRKAQTYSNTMTDERLCELFAEFALRHQARFNALYAILMQE